MLVVVNWGDGGDIASTRLEDALADASAAAAAVVAGRFFRVGNNRRGGMGDTPRRTRKAPYSNNLRSNMMTDHYIGNGRDWVRSSL